MIRDVASASRRRIALGALLLASVALLVAPSGMSFSGGITDDNAGNPAFEAEGCTACHGDHSFAPFSAGEQLTVSIVDAEGNPVGGPYEHDAEYTITITLDEQNEPGANNRAGFNLRVDAGELHAVDGVSQINGAGTQATHVNAASVSWTVGWTAPSEGPVVFDLWVNDVNGDGGPDAGDQVYNFPFYLKDHEGAVPGAVQEHEEHVGVELPQYWVGLIALAGMSVILVFTYFYVKYSSPHHTDKKDR